MKNFILIIGVAVMTTWTTTAGAQTISRSVIGAAGSVHPQLSYTVGEVVIETGTAAGVVLTQGFQQPDLPGSTGGALCNLPAVHTINADTLQDGNYRAFNTIDLVGGTLQSGDNVSLSAGTGIRFLPGFSSASGSSLLAFIEVCTQPVISLQEATAEDIPEIANTLEETGLQLRTFPNPFRESTTIDYYLPAAGPVLLFVTDLNGRIIARLENGADKEQGPQRRIFRKGDLQAGMYLLVLRTREGGITEKLFFLR